MDVHLHAGGKCRDSPLNFAPVLCQPRRKQCPSMTGRLRFNHWLLRIIGLGKIGESECEVPLNLCDRQRTIEHCQAHHFGFGDVRPVAFAFGRKKVGPGSMRHSRLLPFTGQNINRFIGQRMRVRGHGDTRVKFSQHSHATSSFIFVQHQQFDAGVRSRLPGFIFGESDVLKHAFIQNRCGEIAR